MATITSLTSLPDGGGAFSGPNLLQVNSNVSTQNTNNTNVNNEVIAATAAVAAAAAQAGAWTTYHAKYSFAVDGGAISTITPATTASVPNKFVITNVAFNVTTAGASLGSATVSAGLSAGASGVAALVAATAVASLTTNAFIQGKPLPSDCSTWIKMSAAGNITVSIAAAALTAGIIEIYVFGYLSGT